MNNKLRVNFLKGLCLSFITICVLLSLPNGMVILMLYWWVPTTIHVSLIIWIIGIVRKKEGASGWLYGDIAAIIIIGWVLYLGLGIGFVHV